MTEQNFVLWPNLDRVPVINDAYEMMIAEETNNPHGMQQNMQTAHKNFVKQAISMFYAYGREKDAQHWYNYVKNTYTNAFVGKEANMSMEDYAVSQISEDIGETDMNKIEGTILGMFRQEFYYLVRDNDVQAVNYQNMAHKIYNHYAQKIGGGSEVRLGLKPFAQLYQFELDKELDPKTGLPPWAAAILRTKLNLPAAKVVAPAAAAGA